MSENSTPLKLSRTPVHISSSNQPFKPLDWFAYDGPSFGRYVSELCTDDNPGLLVMEETMPGDWPSWERHPQGDEMVIILSGAGTFYQQMDGEIRSAPFKAGDTLINPKGVWHTADVAEPMRAIYVTPCPGTEHKPRQ